MARFGVALWCRGSSPWPEWFATVEAPHAYSAIVQLMAVHRLRRIAWGTALALDGSIRYRCIGLVLRGSVCPADRAFQQSFAWKEGES